MDKVIVASAQLQLRLRSTIDEYREDMRRFARAAEGKGAQLIVFPARAGLGIAPMLARDRGGRMLAQSSAATRQSAGLWQRVRGSAAGWVAQALKADASTSLADLIASQAPVLRDAYMDLFGGLAAESGLTVVAPSAYLPDTDSSLIRHSSFVFGPRGDVLGRQSQVTPGIGLPAAIARGKSWSVIETDAGRLGILIGEDAVCAEAMRILALQGCEVVLAQVACRTAQLNKVTQVALDGVESSAVYAAVSCLVGADPFRSSSAEGFAGKSAILAPHSLTPQSDGVLVALDARQAEGIVTAELNGDLLRALQARRAGAALSDDDLAAELAALYARVESAAANPYATVSDDSGGEDGAARQAPVTGASAAAGSAAVVAGAGEPLHSLSELAVLGSVISRWPLEPNADTVDMVALTEAVTEWPQIRQTEDETVSTIRRDDETDEMEAVEGSALADAESPVEVQVDAVDQADVPVAPVDEADVTGAPRANETVLDETVLDETVLGGNTLEENVVQDEAAEEQSVLSQAISEAESAPPEGIAPPEYDETAGPAPRVAG